LLRGVPPACDVDVGAFPGASCLSRFGGGASVGPLVRWRDWWCQQFTQTALWRADCSRFMPPVPEDQLPGELIARFTGPAHEALMRLLVWLKPLTVGRGQPAAITLGEGH
jgi:hypothetical protein